MMRFRFILPLLLALGVSAATIPAFSDDGHEQAREALQRGEIKSLSEILTMLQKEMPGEVLEIEFERDKGLWIYEIKLIDKSGRFMKVYVDATKNTIIRVKQKYANPDR
ncbi:PepSY domain-containing protein [Microvirga sp. W0021]|uniref:PepSY domain-containing protein n=1 Tax=Hohaiivirga grylli TaxID=3133970 RepID=A0ABV0BFS3_9HYPH